EDANLFNALVSQIINDLVAAGAVGAEQLAIVRQALAMGNASYGDQLLAQSLLNGQIAGGFDKVAKSAKRAGGAAREAVRTIKDYASDLASVMKDALDFRFGFGNSEDKTVKS